MTQRAHRPRIDQIWSMLLLLLPLVLPAQAWSYDVEAGSDSNYVVLRIDDPTGLLRGLVVTAQRESGPEWIRTGEAIIDNGRPLRITMPFAVDPVPVGSEGLLRVRVAGIDGDGETVIARARSIKLMVRSVAGEVQRSPAFEEVHECCGLPAGIESALTGEAVQGLVAVTPNPSSTITYFLVRVPEGGGRVDLTIYDLSGRRLRSLHTPVLDRGLHRLGWDGMLSSGIEAAPGVYFYTLSTAGWMQKGKVQRIR